MNGIQRRGIAILVLLLTACTPGISETSTPAGVEPGSPTDIVRATATPSPAAVASPEASAPSATAPDQQASATPAHAGPPDANVVFVRAEEEEGGTWRFEVAVEHPDTGWEDYADGWDVVTPDGTVLKPDPDSPFTRLLLHPHENEQPFTRSQSGIVIPEGVTTVRVRAHDLVSGFGGREVEVDLTADSGPNFEVAPLSE